MMKGERTTTDGLPPAEGFENEPAPQPIEESTGQHKAYWVLTEEERRKDFQRPVRLVYRHVGKRPHYPLRDLTDEECERFAGFGYAKFEEYPRIPYNSALGRYWTEKQLAGGCGTETRMGIAIAETYAREPKFYGATFCVHCREHLPVDQFVWVQDGPEERVGS